MRQNGQRVHAFGAHAHIAGIAVKVAHLKAHGLCVLQRHVQRTAHLRAKGSAGFRLALHTGDADPAGQRFRHFAAKLFNDLIQVFHISSSL